jgi:signal transduction histidine kinase
MLPMPWMTTGIPLLVAVASAVTALLLARQAVRESCRRLGYLKACAAEVARKQSAGVVSLDGAGKVVEVNDRAAELLGAGPASGRSYADLFRPYSVLLQATRDLVDRGREFGPLEIPVAREHREILLRATGAPLRDAAGGRLGTIVLVFDATRIREVELGARRSERLVGLETLAAAIAHEIRNPLGAMGINLQLLEESLNAGGAGEKARHYLDVVLAETHRLNAIVESFIRFARPRSLEKARTPVAGILDLVLALVKPECDRQGVSVVREVDGRVPPLLVDGSQLQQALLNLVVNALQAMPSGGTLALRLSADPPFARIDVTDSGPGIPAEDVEKVFDLYYTTKKTGLGLGLPIAQKIVTDHLGYLTVRSRPGETCFSMGLPLPSPDEADHGHDADPAAGR